MNKPGQSSLAHPFWFPPKMDDFWPIERIWAILAQRVFRSPGPKTIAAVMQRIREGCRILIREL